MTRDKTRILKLAPLVSIVIPIKPPLIPLVLQIVVPLVLPLFRDRPLV